MTFEFECRMGTLARPRMSGKSTEPTISFVEGYTISPKFLATNG